MAGSKVLKPVAGIVILVGLYAAAGYIGVPAGVRWAVSNVVPDALGGRNATVGDVSFNPWNWSLEINDLAIKSAHSPKNNLLTLKHLSADLSGSTLTEMAPIVEAITVDGFNMHLTANATNNKEAKEAIEKAPADASASSGLPAFSLANVRVTNSSVRLTNAQNGADFKITDIDFALPILSTLPSSASASVNPKLFLKIDGTPIKAEGTLKGDTATMAVKIDKLNVAKILKAAPVTLPVLVEKATASCNLHVSFEMPNSGVSGIKVSGSASVADVDVRELSKQPFVRVKSASIDIKGVDVSAQKADITNIKIVEPSIKASIASQAKSSVQKTQTSAQTATTSSGGSWKWSVGSAHVSNGSDHGHKPQARRNAYRDLNQSGRQRLCIRQRQDRNVYGQRQCCSRQTFVVRETVGFAACRQRNNGRQEPALCNLQSLDQVACGSTAHQGHGRRNGQNRSEIR